jgi:transforming growth factor-beta-induced protein
MDEQTFPSLLPGSDLTISIEGDTIMVNDATVTNPNIVGSNGVIHGIDKILVPPDGVISLPNLVDVASGIPASFETLVAAVVAADLATALSGPGPFTLFAPNEVGFGALPEGTVKDLVGAEDKTPLSDILLYHVVQELITGQDILDGLLSAKTMQGADLTFSVMDGVPMVNGTPVLSTAVATNGIAHVIGEVLFAPTAAPVSGAPTMAPMDEDDGALSTSTVVAALVSAAALLMV